MLMQIDLLLLKVTNNYVFWLKTEENLDVYISSINANANELFQWKIKSVKLKGNMKQQKC
jgi:hypothetical protein